MQFQEKFKYVWMYMARFWMAWSMVKIHSYSNLPPEHVWMAGRGWERLEIKFDFSKFLEKFGQNKGLAWARVSCHWLVSLLSIYRGSLDGKSKQKRLNNQCANIFSLKQIKYLQKIDFSFPYAWITNLARVLGFLGH